MRFAVTGMGVISPIGVGEESFFASLESGRSGVAVDEFGTKEGFPLSARIGDFGARQHIAPANLRRLPRLSQLTIVAAKQALAESKPTYESTRTGVVLGTGLGTLDETIDFVEGYVASGPEAASPMVFPVSVMNAAAGQLALELKLRGVNSTINHRDHSPLSAVAMACDLLELGRADAILVGGIDELSTPVHHAYIRMGGVSRTAMRPYDVERDGLIPGEAVGVVMLEREADAKRRGAHIRAVVTGRGETGEPRPRVGWGHAERWPEAARAVAAAVAAEGPDRVSYVAGSGNGTALDERELQALREGLGGRLPPTSSILAQIGEAFSSGMLRFLSAIYALERQAVPGTLGLQRAASTWEASMVRAWRPLDGGIKSVLVPSFAQGGANLALLVERSESN
jgi:3-oxoacyl-[acyl-carrier-protein] synthase II